MCDILILHYTTWKKTPKTNKTKQKTTPILMIVCGTIKTSGLAFEKGNNLLKFILLLDPK